MPHCTDEGGERAAPDPLEGKGHQAMTPQSSFSDETPSSSIVKERLSRIAQLVEIAKGRPFTTLAHHVDVHWLTVAEEDVRKDGSPGIDGVTSAQYRENLTGNLTGLYERLRHRTWSPPPVRRVDIPKGNGETRSLGIPTYEDKVMQKAVHMLLNPLYRPEFHKDSYGYIEGRSAHQALEALFDTLMRWHGGWVLEVDIRGFFDTLDHDQLLEMLRLKVQDGTVLRWITQWLKAGVSKDGTLLPSEEGTPQGGVISPLLANIYLHNVFDLWFETEVKPRMTGEVRMIRYADDFVIVFTDEDDARKVMDVLPKRFGKYGLTLHPEKTKLIPFHQPLLPGMRKRPGRPTPGSFNLLGFTHTWVQTKTKTWVVQRRTMKSRLTRSLNAIRSYCRRNLHRPLREQTRKLAEKLNGHYEYYGIRGNGKALVRFFKEVLRIRFKWLLRRSRKRNIKKLLGRLRYHLLPWPPPPMDKPRQVAKSIV